MKVVKIKSKKLELLDSAKAFGLLKRHVVLGFPLNARELRWLEKEFFKTIAYIIHKASQKAYGGNKTSASSLNQMTQDDIYGEILVFVFSSKKMFESFDPKKADFVKFLYTSAVRHIRDKSSKYNFGGKSVPRIRRDDSEKVREAKTRARYESSLIYNKETGKEGDQSAIEAGALEYQDLFTKGLFKRLLEDAPAKAALSEVAVNYPLIFSRMVLNLGSDEVFMSKQDRLDEARKEVNKIYSSGFFQEDIIPKDELTNFLTRWRNSKSSSGNLFDLNWLNPTADYDKKMHLIADELGVANKNAIIFLDWIKENFTKLKKNKITRKKALLIVE